LSIASDPALDFDTRIRRIAVILYGVAIASVWLYANLPLHLPDLHRRALNLVTVPALLSLIVVWFFPWERFHRNLFLAITGSALTLIALAIAASGGWRSPLVIVYPLVIVFNAAYYPRRLASLLDCLVVLSSLGPALYQPDIRSLVAYLVLFGPAFLCIGFVADLLMHEVRQRGQEVGALVMQWARDTQELARRAALHRAGIAVGAELDAQRVMETVVHELTVSLGYGFVGVYLREGDAQYLRAQVGFAVPLERIGFDEGVIGRVYRTGRGVLVEDVHADPDYLVTNPAVRSEVCVPVLGDGIVIGTINVESGDRLDQDDLEVLELFAQQIGAALANARLYRAAQEEAEERRKSERDYRTLFERANDAIVIFDPDGEIILDANTRACAMYGRSRDQLIGASLRDFTRDVARGERHLQILVTDGQSDSFETVQHSADGTPLHLLINAAIIEFAGRRVVLSINRDITERKGAEAALRSAETRYRSLVEQIPAIVYLADATRSALLYTSPQRKTMLGYTPEEWTAEPRFWEKVVHPDDLEWVRAADADAIATGGRELVEYRYIAKDGHIIWVRDEAWLIRDDHGRPLYWQGVVVDITERKRAEQAVRESEERFRAQYQGNPVATYTWQRVGDDWVFIDYNRAADAIAGGQISARVGRRASELYGDLPEIRQALAQCDAEQRVISLALPWTFAGTGKRRELIASFVPVPPDLVVLHAEDITERKQAEEELHRHAYDDPLTGLPNRHAFTEILAAAARRADAHPGQVFAVAFLDLDRFKSVNDSLGHYRGDRLLARVAGRFRKYAGPGVTVARFGGDEFALLLEGIGDTDDATAVAERFHAALRAPFRLGGLELRTTASVGIAIGGPASKVGDLLRDADTAMYRAKAGGPGRTAVFDAGMRAAVTRRLTLEAGMQRALERGEFRLVYQPIVALATGAITGFEALVRWEHPRLGLLMPSEFIPIAEETGLIVPLGAWILSEACRQLRAWRRGTLAGEALTIAVNLAARQLAQSELIEQVEHVLTDMDLPPASLHLEITESALVADTDAGLAMLTRLHGLGVGVHLDDFGMEYSSLDYLRRFPIDAIKIDQSFIRDLLASQRDRAVVQAIVTLAHTLGLRVTAEGIETFEQKARLEMLGCDQGQGYFFARPVRANEAQALFAPETIAGEAR